MKIVYITPCKDYLLAEFRERASINLNNIIRRTEWLSWKQMDDVNGKGRKQWYIVADTRIDKDNRLSQFAKILCKDEKYIPSSRLCPHDLYYEDYEMYFSCYSQKGTNLDLKEME